MNYEGHSKDGSIDKEQRRHMALPPRRLPVLLSRIEQLGALQ